MITVRCIGPARSPLSDESAIREFVEASVGHRLPFGVWNFAIGVTTRDLTKGHCARYVCHAN